MVLRMGWMGSWGGGVIMRVMGMVGMCSLGGCGFRIVRDGD